MTSPATADGDGSKDAETIAGAADCFEDEEEEEEPSSPAESLDLMLHHLLPFLIAAALSARSLVGRWRILHAKLSLLLTSLADAAASPFWPSNPLFLHLLPSLLSTLRSLRPLAAPCLHPSLPQGHGKLRLQSDLDLAASALHLHLHHLSLLLRSGLLHRQPSPGANAAAGGSGGGDAYPSDDSAALVLQPPPPSASRADLALFVRDAFARLQIGELDLKLKALDSLVDLLTSDPLKLSCLVADEADLPLLLRLLEHPNSPGHSLLLRDRAAVVVSLLTTTSDAARRALFEEGALGPLLRLLDVGSVTVKDRAAAAVHAITADPACAWAVSAYGGVPILIAACRSGAGSPAVQALAAGSLKNVAAVEDVRSAMVEDGAIPALADLLLSGNLDAQKNAALCLGSLAEIGGVEIRDAILQESGLQRLLQLLRESSDPEVIDHALKAVHVLSASPAAAKFLAASPPFFAQMADLIKRGNASVQQTAASLVAGLSPNDDVKRSMAGSMAALIKMMECSKPTSAQEVAAGALISLLSTRANRKELSKDEKSITRLVQMLDPRNDEVGKKPPISVVLAVTSGGSAGVRKRLAEAGACQHLRKLAEADVAGAKKALQRITCGRLKNLFSLGWPQ